MHLLKGWCSLEIPRLKLVANKRCGVAFAATMKGLPGV
jgi:hypothetical protein